MLYHFYICHNYYYYMNIFRNQNLLPRILEYIFESGQLNLHYWCIAFGRLCNFRSWYYHCYMKQIHRFFYQSTDHFGMSEDCQFYLYRWYMILHY